MEKEFIDSKILIICTQPDPVLPQWDAKELGLASIDCRRIAQSEGRLMLNTVVDEMLAAYRRDYEAVVLLVWKQSLNEIADLFRVRAAGADDVIFLDDPFLSGTLMNSLACLADLLKKAYRFKTEWNLVGKSFAILQTRKQLASALCATESPVILLGETGTGKCHAAHALHCLDPMRAAHPFHILDCGAVTDGLFGSELFGHIYGAFTGAHGNRRGAIASAEKGILLLDEIGDLSRELQSSFLNALQERTFRPVGSDRDLLVECRIIAATHQDLQDLVAKGEFREDLFYRLDGFRVTMPPLRTRREDIPQLFETLIRRNANRSPDTELCIDRDVYDCISSLPLYGNVRALETIARHCARSLTHDGRIRMSHLPLNIVEGKKEKPEDPEPTIAKMVMSGLRWNEIEQECKSQALKAAFDMVRGKHPDIRQRQLLHSAAKILGRCSKTLESWKDQNAH